MSFYAQQHKSRQSFGPNCGWKKQIRTSESTEQPMAATGRERADLVPSQIAWLPCVRRRPWCRDVGRAIPHILSMPQMPHSRARGGAIGSGTRSSVEFGQKDASRNDSRQKNVSIVNGHLSFARCKPLACAALAEALRIRASSRFSVTRLQTDPNRNDK